MKPKVKEQITRSIQLREFSTDTETGTFTGVGVPYGEVYFNGFYNETFAPGSVTVAEHAVILYRHDEPVGSIISAEDTPAGVVITGKLSKIAAAKDILTLMRDGVLTGLSIGARIDDYDFDEDEDTITYSRATAFEFSLTPTPAYDTARLSAVREKPRQGEKMNPKTATPMPEVDTTRLDDIERSLDTVERRLKSLSTTTAPAPIEYRSMGAFLKAIAAGDETALNLHREYTGATTADVPQKPTFIGNFIKYATDRRDIVNSFSTATLPAEGMSLDYYQLESETLTVEEQVKEGDELPYGKIKLNDANTKVKTYGGWTELSRQEIERGSTPALDITLKTLAMKYGQVTNAAAAAVYKELIKTNLGESGKHIEAGATLAALDYDKWLDLFIDLFSKFKEPGLFNVDGFHVSKDVFTALAHVNDGVGNRVLKLETSNTASGTIGNLNLHALTGELLSVPVILAPQLDAGTFVAFDKQAIITFESAGAPAQLQDENIINLTKQFSVYGYAAVAAPYPAAIVPVKFGG